MIKSQKKSDRCCPKLCCFRGVRASDAALSVAPEEDILTRLAWIHYRRPVDAPHIVRIFHHKTRKLVDLPLYDDDDTTLWPDLMARLDSGTLIQASALGRAVVSRRAERPEVARRANKCTARQLHVA